ncbi:MAG TPA: tRNA lysidine(34) synthetase TilS [Candidatus Sulfotelmatobacter sp.]|nr:tRNA lysidine(34) synthetase TilS [Candidatus Sulfotelmatobacter sp.]
MFVVSANDLAECRLRNADCLPHHVLVLSVTQRVARYIRKRELMHAGNRVAVAVSGGADSVGLLRILLELREELGTVLSVAHFHHGIRGADADADEKFVAELASTFGLEFHLGRGDARAYAAQKKISLETAARQLRRGFFESLPANGIKRIATAHTLDDQAETVLMKVVRGAGTRGMAGIFPEQRLGSSSIVRPLLGIHREEIRAYLGNLGQPWRDDLTNSDLTITRNRVRARVLPGLREELNPAVDISLAHLAEISRAEEEYWAEQTKRLLPVVSRSGEPARGGGRRQTSAGAIGLDIQTFRQQPLALQRRLLRAAAEQIGCGLDFEHVDEIVDLLSRRQMRGAQTKTVQIGDGWDARLLFRELRIERSTTELAAKDYEYLLPVPGESRIPELGATIRASICEDNGSVISAAYNRAHAFELSSESNLRVRNWRAGDRFRPARHTSEKRVKELLYPLHLSAGEKRVWPVVVAGECIVWVRGIEAPTLLASSGQQIVIEESTD